MTMFEAVQTPTGMRRLVRLYNLHNNPFGEFHLSDGTVALPDADGFLIVDSTQAASLLAAGWVPHADQTVSGPAGTGLPV